MRELLIREWRVLHPNVIVRNYRLTKTATRSFPCDATANPSMQNRLPLQWLTRHRSVRADKALKSDRCAVRRMPERRISGIGAPFQGCCPQVRRHNVERLIWELHQAPVMKG
jgi:hypothetical protein